MPSYAPRTGPVKKQEELTKREKELAFAIKKNIPTDKLRKFAEKYRQAQLSMLKARIHVFKENELQKKQNNTKLERLEALIIEWTEKSSDDIIGDFKKPHNPQY
jgi:hypothetical protein